MLGLLVPMTAFGLLLKRSPLLGPVRVSSRAAPPLRAVPHMSEEPPENYEPQRACELMIESLGLSYGDTRGTVNGGGSLINKYYQTALDSQDKAQLVLSDSSDVTDTSSKDFRHATVVFRGTDPDCIEDVIRDVEYLTTSAHCFSAERSDEFISIKGDMYGTVGDTGLFESLLSSARDPLGPQVHRGFARRALKYSRWVQDKLRERFPPGEEHTDPKWNHGGIGNLKKLYVTGHSLGGAAALAFAYWVKLAFEETNPDLVVHVYVFSAPSVGNKAWAEHYNQMLGNTTFQHNYGPDFVPQYPPWLWRVGHVVRIEHMEYEGLFSVRGKPAKEKKYDWPEDWREDMSEDFWPEDMSEDDKAANFFPQFDYHLELPRVFVPYFEHLQPGSAEDAWMGYRTVLVKLQYNIKGSQDVKEEKLSFQDTEWGQKLMPSRLAIEDKGIRKDKETTVRKPHFTMKEIKAIWSFPSNDPDYKLKNLAMTVFNLAVLLYVLGRTTQAVLSEGAPLAALMVGSPFVAGLVNFGLQRNGLLR